MLRTSEIQCMFKQTIESESMSWLLRSSIKKETFAIHQPEIAGVVGMVSCETIWCLTWKEEENSSNLRKMWTRDTNKNEMLIETKRPHMSKFIIIPKRIP